MGLPGVKISFGNGAIGGVKALEDGVVGLICNGESAGSTFVVGTPYLLKSLKDLELLGVTGSSTGGNKVMYDAVARFYSEAPVGAKLWVRAVSNANLAIDTMVKEDVVRPLLEAAGGEIGMVMVKVSEPSGYSPTVTGGMDAKVLTAMTNAQAMAEKMTEELKNPLMVLLEARHYGGDASKFASSSLKQKGCNRVCVVVGDVTRNSKGAAVELVAGRLAGVPVQRSLVRVRDGAIKAEKMWFKDKEAGNSDAEILSSAGFICPRTFVGKSGYYWADDPMCSGEDDEYGYIPRRRVIDKACRVAYGVLLEEVGEEIAVTSEGKISGTKLKAIEGAVEGAIVRMMTSEGNLGVDPGDGNDLGCDCWIDADQDIVSSGVLKVGLRVRPFGYAKSIEVELGYEIN